MSVRDTEVYAGTFLEEKRLEACFYNDWNWLIKWGIRKGENGKIIRLEI